jgi:hypothetical protein
MGDSTCEPPYGVEFLGVEELGLKVLLLRHIENGSCYGWGSMIR